MSNFVIDIEKCAGQVPHSQQNTQQPPRKLPPNQLDPEFPSNLQIPQPPSDQLLLSRSADFRTESQYEPLSLINEKQRIECSRRTSTSSLTSVPETRSPINYDSGNYSEFSFQRPPSMSSAEDELDSNFAVQQKPFLQREIRERDQSLFLALQDVRKLKSELDRLSKSEKWYKSELKIQKRSRLEILEKLYLNERNFLRENQKLQTEASRLLGIITEIERKSVQDKEQLIRQLKESRRTSRENSPSGKDVKLLKFEIRKQKSLIQDQENLIEVLRKQKQSLLNDLKSLTVEKDAKILILEQGAAVIESENRKITEKCKNIILEKKLLEENLQNFENDNFFKDKALTFPIESENFGDDNSSKDKASTFTMESLIIPVQRATFDKEHLVSPSLQPNNYLNTELTPPLLLESFFTSSNEIPIYKYEIEQKNVEISKLKELYSTQQLKIQTLQSELNTFTKLRAKLDQQQREFERIQSKFAEQSFEIEQSKKSHSLEIDKLAAELYEYKNLRQNFEKHTQLLKASNDELLQKEMDLNQVQSFFENQKFQIHELEKENSRIENENRKLFHQLEELKAELNQLSRNDDKLCRLQNQIEDQQHEISQLKSKNFEKLEESFYALQEELQLKNFKLEESHIKIQTLQQEKLNLLDEVQNFKEMTKHFEDLKKKFEIKISDFKELKLQKENLDIFKLKYEEIIANFEKIQSELDFRSKQNEDLNVQLKHLENIRTDYETVCKQLETLRFDLEAKNFENEKLKKEGLNQFPNDFQENLNSYETLKIEFDIKTSNFEKLKLDFEDKSLALEQLKLVANQQTEIISKLNGEKNLTRESFTHFNESNNRIETLRALLEQQSGKVLRLSREQDEWQRLLDTLRETQINECLIEPVLENLHADQLTTIMFYEKRDENEENLANAELQLNLSKKIEESLISKSEALNKAHEKELRDTKATLQGKDFELQKLHEIFEKKSEEILELKRMNQSAIEKFSEEFTLERQSNKKSVELLETELKISNEKLQKVQLQNDNLIKEQTELAVNSSSYEKEKVENSEQLKVLANELKNKILEFENVQKKNEDLVRNYEILQKSTRNSEEACHKSAELHKAKLLNRVLETEHKRKISRYEIHIRTLLSNCKSYKKNLEIVEQEHGKLLEKYNSLNCERLQYEQQNLEKVNDLTEKYEESQKIIKMLKSQLAAERVIQLNNIDFYKKYSLNQENLMDDHKMLIHPVNANNPSCTTTNVNFSHISDLINKSNNFVPNFNLLNKSIGDLKGDIHAQLNNNSPKRKSLMEELEEISAVENF